MLNVLGSMMPKSNRATWSVSLTDFARKGRTCEIVGPKAGRNEAGEVGAGRSSSAWGAVAGAITNVCLSLYLERS